ncbi:protein kinase [Nevskia sp.]|uniref:protein kinase domain-containing protein n=1 Tax=Nevskia sp. TaxID=1929292 RepID=UPI0025EDA897|nr:FHA domain-containing serine/threonine-protein kinase [Nevskia sp.]
MIAIGNKLDGKYLVVGRLGSGGFGEVFLAEDVAIPGRQLALKVLSAKSAGDHGDLIWEMRTLAKFNHPAIVGFHHHFQHGDRLVLVMEFCAGGSLHDRLDAAGPVTQDEVFRWAAVLFEAMAFVHDKGIVHHDIKPANILFSQDGGIKLGDFGVANRDGGTRRYMAPEMLLGEAVTRTDPRVDIYALALTLIEMLSGEHPFEGLSPADSLKRRIAHDFVPRDLPRWVQDILLRASHPTPELRFQKMADFAEAIAAKHVPYVFDGKRIKAHALAEKAEAQLLKKKWKAAENLASHALRVCPESTMALVVAGRCHLMVRRTRQAREYLSRALGINPRMHVQKELGWLNLEEGNLPTAISLLGDHLDRNASDFEAWNLLLRCFFLSGRYEAGEKLAQMVMRVSSANECFRNNRFVCRLLNDGYSARELADIDATEIVSPFIVFNLTVARESPSSWQADGPPFLRDKLLFQEYGWGLGRSSAKLNTLAVRMPDGSAFESAAPVISIGKLASNDVVLASPSVSRRHAVIVNFANDVWLHDLGGNFGTRLGEDRVSGRIHLDGVHKLLMGRVSVEIAAQSNLLV